MSKQPIRDGVFQRSDCKGWYASYVDANGIRRKKRVQAHTRPQAVDALGLIKAKVQKEQLTGVKQVSDMTVADLFVKYKRHQKTRVVRTTLDRMDSLLKTLAANLPPRVRDISKLTIAEYVGKRSQVMAPASVHKEIATLKHVLRLAVDWELIPSNPAERAKLPKLPQGRTRYLSPTELKSVLEAAPDWMKAPLALAAFTGMRRGELLGIRWRDVDLANRHIYLHETKNGSLRVVPLNVLAYEVITSLPSGKPEDVILAGVDGPRLSVYTRRLFSSLGIKDASYHSLRHTAASWLVMQGVDLYAVGQVLGHRTPRMTQRYAHLSPKYVAGAVSKLDGVFGDVMPPKSRDAHGTNFDANGTERLLTGASNE